MALLCADAHAAQPEGFHRAGSRYAEPDLPVLARGEIRQVEAGTQLNLDPEGVLGGLSATGIAHVVGIPVRNEAEVVDIAPAGRICSRLTVPQGGAQRDPVCPQDRARDRPGEHRRLDAAGAARRRCRSRLRALRRARRFRRARRQARRRRSAPAPRPSTMPRPHWRRARRGASALSPAGGAGRAALSLADLPRLPAPSRRSRRCLALALHERDHGAARRLSAGDL